MAATLTELETGATWPLREEEALALPPDVLRWTIGRREIANVQLMHPWIAKGHAMLDLREGRSWWVIDSGSHAGVLLNGHEVGHCGERELRHGDVLGLGATSLRFDLTDVP